MKNKLYESIIGLTNPFSEVSLDDSSLDFTIDEWEKLFKISRLNKLSLAFLDKEKIPKKVKEWIEKDIEQKKKFKKTIHFVHQKFSEYKIEYAVIKSCKNYDAFVNDVDVNLGERDVKVVVAILRESGYKIDKGGDPTKIKAQLGESNIDIYPFVRWLKHSTIILDTDKLLNRRNLINYQGEDVYVPSKEDDLLILCSHDFAHTKIPIGDLYHAIKQVESKPNWDYIIETAEKKEVLSIFSFLYILKLFSHQKLGFEIELKQILPKLQRYKSVRLARGIIDRNIGRMMKRYPIKLPISLIFLSTVVSLATALKELDMKKIWYNLHTHFFLFKNAFEIRWKWRNI